MLLPSPVTFEGWTETKKEKTTIRKNKQTSKQTATTNKLKPMPAG